MQISQHPLKNIGFFVISEIHIFQRFKNKGADKNWREHGFQVKRESPF